MYDDAELEISPNYQRLFRWSLNQQSRFIESLLLGLPIPPIFAIETEERRYELIDGLQRISSYLHFIGILKNHDLYGGEKLKLTNCEIVPDLNGLTYNDLPNSLRIKVKRSYIRLYIIKRKSPPRVKYDMFKRLNTGGSLLSAQEIRNSTIRLLDHRLMDLIDSLSENTSFEKCITTVEDNDKKKQFDKELVLRYFALRYVEKYKSFVSKEENTLADYLTFFAEQVAQEELNFDYEKEEVLFKKVFDQLNASLGENVFKKKKGKEEDFQSQFRAFEYEALSVGLSKVLEKNPTSTDFKEKILTLKGQEKYSAYTENKQHKRTSGSKYFEFLEKRIKLAKRELG